MSSAATLTLAHDALLPREPGGNGPGAALALLVHAGLVAALTVSVDWRTQSSDVVAAELWAAVPQAAAPMPAVPAVVAPVAPPATPPPAPAPPPPRAAPQPPEADIATERAERRKVEAARKKAQAEAEAETKRTKRELAEAERKKLELTQADRKKRERAEHEAREARDAREAQAEDERLARQREANLRRMMGQAGTANAGTGTAVQAAAPSAAYSGRLVALIRGNLVFTGSTPDNDAAEVEVSAAAGGAIISRRLVKSSGHKDWDEAVLRAIDRTATLPRDTDGRVPPRLLIAFRPKN